MGRVLDGVAVALERGDHLLLLGVVLIRAGNVCASIKRCPPKHLAYDAAPSAVLAPSRLTPLVRRILDVHAASLASKRLPRAFRTRRCACSAAAARPSGA